ncbi:CAP domain-containing protein [Leisingera sp. ANG-M7]|uniref:CAP domain-containing protein n=1 Tax=Leisingera sp. ANG-M7 TaxID=1577902 RepID=UPI00057F2973|nr:CAP domain-containing protein [Leisingera sp. ANG-M7]KIC36795.1 hypothetical protein RA26_10745 [Leisingera sp. ANG-M7]
MSQASDLERQMLELINAERTSRGLNPVQLELRLNESAEDHSDWMLQQDVFSHTGAGGSSAGDRMEDAGFVFSGSWTWAENIAWQSERGAPGLADDVIDLHNALMNSPGHRANILNANVEVIGIGIEQGNFNGWDAVMVTQNFAKTSAELQLDTGSGGGSQPTSGNDNLTLTSAGSLEGLAGNDTLNGSAGNDNLLGQDGRDLLQGGHGADSLYGGAHSDTLNGEGGDDKMWAGDGSDTLNGGNGHDTMYGNRGDDKLWGLDGNDTIDGGKGHDVLYGNLGLDTLWGGDGNDTMDGGRGNDLLFGNMGFDVMLGGDGSDTLNGGNGNDNLAGNFGDDRLNGDGGSDTLSGGTGHDTLDGGAGNDLLSGNGGGDLFIFSAGDDTVSDFDPNASGELIDLRPADGITSFSDLMTNHTSQTANGLLITDGNGDSMLLTGITEQDLSSGDFLF